MARKTMITRTLQVNEIDTLCVNIETNDVFNNKTFVFGKIREKDFLKIAKKELESDIVKVVHIQKVDSIVELRGMTEEEFYINSQLLPPR